MKTTTQTKRTYTKEEICRILEIEESKVTHISTSFNGDVTFYLED